MNHRGVSLAWKRGLPLLAVAVAGIVVASPAFGFSHGITDDNAGLPSFEELGCTACHGPGSAAPHEFAPDEGLVTWTIVDADGEPLKGSVYDAHATYTITIKLEEQNVPDGTNHAGFNLRAGAGTLEGVEGQSQTNGAGTQATHVDASRTSWNVTWTPPAEGAVVFELYVNDVDDSGSPNPGDRVYREFFGLTDEAGARLGAAGGGEVEEEVGVPLPQYWLGLTALAGMLAVLLFAFVYLKFMNPHHTDSKDR